MMGSNRTAQVRAVADQVTGAVKSAGTVVMVALAVAGAALVIAAVALVLVTRPAAPVLDLR